MKIKLSWEFVIGVGYICFTVGGTYAFIGEHRPEYTIEWYDPIMAFIILTLPFYLGFKSGEKQ